MEASAHNANNMQLAIDTCIIVLFCCLLQGLNGLRMIKVSIPAFKLRGESAFLECQYELSRHKTMGVYDSDKDGGRDHGNGDMNYSEVDARGEDPHSNYPRTHTYQYQYQNQNQNHQNHHSQHQQRRQRPYQRQQKQQPRQFKRFANAASSVHYQYQQQYQHQQQQQQQQQQPYQQYQQYQYQEEQYEQRSPQTQQSPYGHSIYRGRSQPSSSSSSASSSASLSSSSYPISNYGGGRTIVRTHTHTHAASADTIDSREHGTSFIDSAEDSRQRAFRVDNNRKADEDDEEDEEEAEEDEEEGEALYAIKWYKDNEEFYRYVPKANPPKTSYRVDGIRVIEEHSDSSRVLLRGLTLNSTGLYRCEISAEAPNFSSVQGEGRMDIVYLPRDGPHIKGQQFQYQIGEILNLNCTSGKSHPASHLQWFINDQPIVDKRFLISYNDTVHKHGLITSTLGLELVVDSRHFVNGAMRVKCLASISPVLWKGGKESVLQRRPGIIDNREAMLLVRGSAPSIIHQAGFLSKLLLIIFVFTISRVCQLQPPRGLI